MKASSSLIAEFYRAVSSWGFAGSRVKDGYNCLVRIGAASGFRNDNESQIAFRGMRVVAVENTDNAATALTMYILLTQGYMWTVGASYIAKMIAPSASAGLDELVRKAWDDMCRADFVRERQAHDWALNRRRQPTKNVFIDMRNLAKSHGYRVIRTAADAHHGLYYSSSPMEGWIKPDGSYSLGIDLEVEVGGGELVLNTAREAYACANRLGWTVVNEDEIK